MNHSYYTQAAENLGRKNECQKSERTEEKKKKICVLYENQKFESDKSVAGISFNRLYL